MVQEFMSRGDLFTALSDSSLRHDLSWRKRQAPPLLSCFAVKKGYMSTCRCSVCVHLQLNVQH